MFQIETDNNRSRPDSPVIIRNRAPDSPFPGRAKGALAAGGAPQDSTDDLDVKV